MLISDHHKIKEWVDKHNGSPALIDDPDAESDTIGLHIDFPGRSDEMYLRDKEVLPVNWNTFFTIFDDQELSLEINEDKFDKDPNSSYRFHVRSQIKK